MKQKPIISIILFLAIAINAMSQDYIRALRVHSGDNVTQYELPEEANAFVVEKYEYSSAPAGSENGYEYVDLGLPSGLMWATHNLGATHPLEFGNYYAWGELKEDLKVVNDTLRYDWINYKFSTNGTEPEMTKYCTLPEYGHVDGKKILDLSDDVAHVEWGGKWRMPTKEDYIELGNYCEFIRGYIDGVYGIAIKSRINGAAIYAPASGVYLSWLYVHPSTGLTNQNMGAYWSSSLYDGTDNQGELSAYFGTFDEQNINLTGILRCLGLSIRAVYDPFLVEDTEEIPEYVDLGLPSGIKIGTCNLGATKPHEYGNFYAWGKDPNLKYAENDPTIYLDSSCFPVENPSCDPVTIEKGEGWRLPTKEDVLEAYEHCTFKKGYSNGVYGLYVIGANGNFIFVPAAGFTLQGSHFAYPALDTEVGVYWYSTMDEDDETQTKAYAGGFTQVELELLTLERLLGASIRPIYDSRMLSDESNLNDK